MLCVFELNEHGIETPLYFSYPNGYAERAGAAYILADFHHAITRGFLQPLRMDGNRYPLKPIPLLGNLDW